jgi:hypothetical protein
MRRIPGVIASTDGRVGIEVLEFEGVDRIANRDAFGFYYTIRLSPGRDTSRIAVLFSGTALLVRPDAFGLPDEGDRDANFTMFAYAAIGDFLDENGLPPHTQGGKPAFQIECFSPRFQMWEDRPPAEDPIVERYIRSQLYWAWRFGHEEVELSSPDAVRLSLPVPQIARLLKLGEGIEWTVIERDTSAIRLSPTQQLLRAERDHREGAPGPDRAQTETSPDPAEEEQPRTAVEQMPVAAVLPEPSYLFVDETRIADLRNIGQTEFDLRKLLAICEELNICHRSQCYHAVAALTRSLLDHVPPIFGVRSFCEVVNNYAGTRSFRESMEHLDRSARKIADAHLHGQVRAKESLPTRTQVNFSNDIDVLLAEVTRILSS